MLSFWRIDEVWRLQLVVLQLVFSSLTRVKFDVVEIP